MLDTIHPQKGFLAAVQLQHLCTITLLDHPLFCFVFCLFLFLSFFFSFFLSFLIFIFFALPVSFVWEAFWSRLTPQHTVLADSSVYKCCSTFRERQKPSSKSLWNQDSRSCFGQRQDCTLGGQDVSCETQSKSVFRIKISIKILKIPNKNIKKSTKRELKTDIYL